MPRRDRDCWNEASSEPSGRLPDPNAVAPSLCRQKKTGRLKFFGCSVPPWRPSGVTRKRATLLLRLRSDDYFAAPWASLTVEFVHVELMPVGAFHFDPAHLAHLLLLGDECFSIALRSD